MEKWNIVYYPNVFSSRLAMRNILPVILIVAILAVGGFYVFAPNGLSRPPHTNLLSSTSNSRSLTASSSGATTTTTARTSSSSVSTSPTTLTGSSSQTTLTSTARSTTSTTRTSTTSSSIGVFFYFESGSAVYLNNSQMETNITVTLVDNGSMALWPSAMKDKVPPGTSLVEGTWSAYYYDPSGSLICTAPRGCNPSLIPGVEDGGHIVVNMLVTGATVGEPLTLTYSSNGLTESYTLGVTG